MLHRSKILCSGLGRVLVWIWLGLSIGEAARSQSACPEGAFLDPTSPEADLCRPLLTRRGFDGEAFARSRRDTVVYVSAERCSEAGLRDALRAVRRADGGTVDLSACDVVDLVTPLSMPDRTLLTGGTADPPPLIRKAGIDPTSLIWLHRAEHVVLRNLRLDGRNVSKLVVEVQYARNVLIERVELTNGRNNGVNFAYSTGFTVRHSIVSGHGFNGITSKDCYTHYGPGLSDCIAFLDERAGGDFSPGSRFSHDYALYGNTGADNGDYCLAMHARRGEIAGNVCRSNRRGVKLPDAQAVVVHRNLIVENREAGVHVYAPIAGLPVYGVVVAGNRIVENGGYPARLYGAEAALLDNTIEANACSGHCAGDRPHDAIVNGEQAYADETEVDADTEICGDTDEHAILLGGAFGPILPRLLAEVPPGGCLDALPGHAAFARLSALSTPVGIDVSWISTEPVFDARYVVEIAPGDEPFRQAASVGALTRDDLPSHSVRIETATGGRHRVRVRKTRPGEADVVSPVRVVERPVEHRVGSMQIHPQPARRVARVELSPSQSGASEAVLLDLLGRRMRTIFRGRLEAGETRRLTIRVENLAPGIYWVHFRLQGGVQVRPLVVTR